MKVLLILITSLTQLSLAACNRSANPTSPTEGSTPAAVAEVQGPLELTSIDLHKVKLPYPYRFREKDGKEKRYEQAWLVLLHFKNLGPVRNQRMDLFIGDYRVPEYGGLKDGIYFRIYEESLLKSLDGKEVSVSLAGEKEHSLGKKFSTAGYEKQTLEEESTILKR